MVTRACALSAGSFVTLADAFERVLIINLPERIDRRRDTEAELSRVGSPVDGERIAFFKAARPPEAAPFASIGAHGCFLSHLSVLRLAQRERLSSVLILEDDIAFAADAPARFGELAALMASGRCDIVYGNSERAQTGAPTFVPLSPDVGFIGTHMVGFSERAMGHAVPYLEAMLARPPGSADGGPMPVDGAYVWLRRAFPELRVFAAAPDLGLQRSSRSDISPRRWFDRTPAFMNLAERLRRVRNAVVRKRRRH